MKRQDKIVVIGGAVLSAAVSITVMWWVWTGIFYVMEFSQQIEKNHANNKEALEQYRLFCQLIAFNFGVQA